MSFPVHFTRNGSGDLTYVGTGGSIGGQISNITVSPDGKSVYTSNINQPGGLIGVYQTTTTGSGLAYRQCWASVATSYGCVLTTNGYVDEPSDLLVTADNKQLLLANGDNTGTDYSSGSLVGFTRTTSGRRRATSLRRRPRPAFNRPPRSLTARCGAARFDPRAVVDQQLADLRRRLLRGFPARSQRVDQRPDVAADVNACRSYESSGFTCATLNPNASRVFQHRDVVIPADGRNIYSENENGTAATIHGFSRSSTSGASSAAVSAPMPQRRRRRRLRAHADRRRRHTTNNGLIASGRNVYAAAGTGFQLRPRPRAGVSERQRQHCAQHRGDVTLNCTDPDGDVVTYQKVDDPAHGSVGGVQSNRISYGPQLGTSGADSFHYRALSAGAASDVATVTVNVAGPPAPPTGGGGGGGGGGDPAAAADPVDGHEQLAGLPGGLHQGHQPLGEQPAGRHDRAS